MRGRAVSCALARALVQPPRDAGAFRCIPICALIALSWLLTALGAWSNPSVSRFRLSSGAQVVVERVPDAPLVAIEVWVRAGVADETPQTSGAAHLLEHLIFKGTATLPPGALDEAFEQAGGVLDAFTERDWTRFHASVLPAQWQLPLQRLLHCLFQPQLSPDELAKERRLILSDEYALHHADPIRPARYALFAQAFPNHAYGLPLLGDPETLARLERDALQQFHKAHYRPERMVVVVAGAVEPESVRKVVEGALPELPAIHPPLAYDAPAGEGKLFVVSQGACLAFGVRTPPARDVEAWLCAEVLRVALAEPHRGLLYEGETLPFGRLHSEYLPRLQGSLLAFYALPPLQPQADWQATLRQRLERALQRIAQGEVRHALEQARGVALARHEATMRNYLERARWHGLCATLGIALSPEEYAARLSLLPIEQVERFAKAMLAPASPADATAPQDASAVPSPSQGRDVFRLQRHAPLPAPDRRTVARQRLTNGLRVVAIAAPDAESVVVQVAVGHRHGEFSPAVGELTAWMLFGETQNETERTLAARIARSGGSLRIEWSPAGTLITAFARPDSVVNVLSLLKEALFRAEMTESALQRAVARAVYERRYYEGAQGWRLLARNGEYLADESALSRVPLSAVRRYYDAHYRPENTVIVIAGAQRVEQLTEYVRSLFGEAWATTPTPPVSKSAALTRLALFTLTDPCGLGYAGYCWEASGVSPTEYYALQAWQLLLGEGKRARLFVETREQRGVGYALRTQTYMLRDGVLGVGWVQTAKSPADAAVVRAALTAPIQPEEHRRALALLRGEWERLRLNLSAFTATLAWAELSGLGYSTLWDAPPTAETLSSQVLEAVRRRWLRF